MSPIGRFLLSAAIGAAVACLWEIAHSLHRIADVMIGPPPLIQVWHSSDRVPQGFQVDTVPMGKSGEVLQWGPIKGSPSVDKKRMPADAQKHVDQEDQGH